VPAFADYYTANSEDFPRETQESRYFDRLMHAYPIHPEVFDRLYEDWSSLDNFQRTRGVLKLMAKVIHRLWKDNDKDPLIMPGSFPLQDADTRNEVIYYLPQGWDPVVERDVDGERAETTEIENRDTRLGSVQACRRSARAIFLGSAPSTSNQMVRGLELERVALWAWRSRASRSASTRTRCVAWATAALPEQRQQPLLVRYPPEPAPRNGGAQAPLPGQGRRVPRHP
jgi:predicted AAA+ superfamily ATPase